MNYFCAGSPRAELVYRLAQERALDSIRTRLAIRQVIEFTLAVRFHRSHFACPARNSYIQLFLNEISVVTTMFEIGVLKRLIARYDLFANGRPVQICCVAVLLAFHCRLLCVQL